MTPEDRAAGLSSKQRHANSLGRPRWCLLCWPETLFSVAFCSPAKSLTSSGLVENPLVLITLRVGTPTKKNFEAVVCQWSGPKESKESIESAGTVFVGGFPFVFLVSFAQKGYPQKRRQPHINPEHREMRPSLLWSSTSHFASDLLRPP